MNKKINLLDATIRDGGFYNNYNFSLDNIESLIKGLERTGLKWIEIGHGFGVNAENSISPMAYSETEYLETALAFKRDSKVGMFAFPNIATPDRVEELARIGLDFIRIGFFDLNETPYSLRDARPLFEMAKKNDLYISANIVRTQQYTGIELQNVMQELIKLSPDCVCVVDSPGGAMPIQIGQQIKIVKDYFDGDIGFHGHQNFTLGVANSLAAMAAGATFVDGTLRGIGRDSGNTQLELLAAVACKVGYNIDVDVVKLCEFSDTFMLNLLKEERGVKTDNIFLAYYDLMTHELPLIKKEAANNNINWHDLAKNFTKKRIKFGTDENIYKLVGDLIQ